MFDYYRHKIEPLNDELFESLRLPKKLENYKVNYQEIVGCSWCQNLHDVRTMVRGDGPTTQESWFCSPYCEAAYLSDESEELFSLVDEDVPDEYGRLDDND